MRQHAEARLAEFLKPTRARSRDIAGTVRLGLAVREIVAEVDDWGADLVALGTRGRIGVLRFLIGSVAESVSRKASCDVLMIPSTAIEPGQSGTDRLPSDDVAWEGAGACARGVSGQQPPWTRCNDPGIETTVKADLGHE